VVALSRAIEHARPARTRIVDDPYAEWFLRPSMRAALASWKIGGPTSRVVDRLDPGGNTFVVCRHRFIDDHLLGSLDAGIQQVLILGAGYDMRAWRFRQQLEGRAVFEVDLQAIGDRKARVLERHRRELEPIDRHRVVIDFEVQTLADALVPAGFAAGTPTFVVWEGVAPYLTRSAVKDTLTSVASLVGIGSRLAMDLWYVVDDPSPRGSLVRSAPSALSLIGEPVTFPMHPEEAGFFLGRFGWEIVDLADGPDLKRRYAGGRSLAPSVYLVTAALMAPGRPCP
jgi:methyltransferase (TIGR00027 family)